MDTLVGAAAGKQRFELLLLALGLREQGDALDIVGP